MINMIMRAFSPKIIVHLNMCTSCVTHSSPIDGFSNLEFCCPYIITSAYYRPKNEEKTGLNYLMMDILDTLQFGQLCRAPDTLILFMKMKDFRIRPNNIQSYTN